MNLARNDEELISQKLTDLKILFPDGDGYTINKGFIENVTEGIELPEDFEKLKLNIRNEIGKIWKDSEKLMEKTVNILSDTIYNDEYYQPLLLVQEAKQKEDIMQRYISVHNEMIEKYPDFEDRAKKLVEKEILEAKDFGYIINPGIMEKIQEDYNESFMDRLLKTTDIRDGLKKSARETIRKLYPELDNDQLEFVIPLVMVV